MNFMQYKLVHSVNEYAPVTGTDFGFTVLKYEDYVILEADLANRVVSAGGSDNYEIVEDFDADAVIAQDPAFLGAPLTLERLEQVTEQYLSVLDPELLVTPKTEEAPVVESTDAQTVLDVATFDFEDDVDQNEHEGLPADDAEEPTDSTEDLAELVELAELLVDDAEDPTDSVSSTEDLGLQVQPFPRPQGRRPRRTPTGS